MRTRNIGYVLPFILLSLLHILAIEGGEELLRVATKPFLIPALAWAYYRVTPNFYKLVLLALFFSFLGDVFLLGEGSLFFLAGLGSFLITHVLYSALLMKLQSWCPRAVLLSTLIFGTYAVGFMTLLYPTLDTYLYPVMGYALVICFFGMLAFHAFYTQPSQGLVILLGATLFILSDSLIAINTFYVDYTYFSTSIMVTYLLAQALIVYYFSQEVVS